MTTRTATTEDVPLIQALAQVIWRPTYKEILTPEQMEYMMEKMYSTDSLNGQMTAQTFLLLYDGETPIGYAAYAPAAATGTYKLHKIYLHQDHQGKGAGKFLLNAVINAVKAQAAHTLELDVNRYNKAKFFYEKMGFTVFEEKDTDIGNGYWMNDYIMRKQLL